MFSTLAGGEFRSGWCWWVDRLMKTCKKCGGAEFYARNCKHCCSVRMALWNKKNPYQSWPEEKKKKSYENNRRWKLRQNGWTPEAVSAAKVRQQGLCAICSKKKLLGGDHKHGKPPLPRGLLCRSCNLGLGCFGDSRELLFAAEAYLRFWGQLKGM